MFESVGGNATRRDVLKTSAVGVGASMGLVGTASAAEDVVEFDGSLTVTPEDSGTTFRQIADFDGGVRVEFGVEDVTVDGNGHTISGGGSGGGGVDGEEMADVTFRNLHLPDGGLSLHSVSGVIVRNNVANGLYVERGNGVRVVDNTFDGTIGTEENFSEAVFAGNVASSIRLWGDLSGSHRVTNNFVTGSDDRAGIDIQQGVTTGSSGKISCLENYVGNAGRSGIEVSEDFDMTVQIHRNVVVGSADHGLDSLYPPTDVGENAFVGNGGNGVHGYVSRLKRNVATANDGDGFHVAVGRECLRNAAVSNGGAGFRFSEVEPGFGFGGSSGDARVKFNRSTGNDDGMVLSGVTVGEVRKNDVTANDGDGLVLADADDNGITRNWICGNGGEGLAVDDDSTSNRFAKNLVC